MHNSTWEKVLLSLLSRLLVVQTLLLTLLAPSSVVVATSALVAVIWGLGYGLRGLALNSFG